MSAKHIDTGSLTEPKSKAAVGETGPITTSTSLNATLKSSIFLVGLISHVGLRKAYILGYLYDRIWSSSQSISNSLPSVPSGSSSSNLK